MITFLLALVIFIQFLEYIIILDIILSWLVIIGIPFRPKIIASILDPLYHFIRKYIPTNFGIFDFTALILIFALIFMRGFLFIVFPELQIAINSLSHF